MTGMIQHTFHLVLRAWLFLVGKKMQQQFSLTFALFLQWLLWLIRGVLPLHGILWLVVGTWTTVQNSCQARQAATSSQSRRLERLLAMRNPFTTPTHPKKQERWSFPLTIPAPGGGRWQLTDTLSANQLRPKTPILALMMDNLWIILISTNLISACKGDIFSFKIWRKKRGVMC